METTTIGRFDRTKGALERGREIVCGRAGIMLDEEFGTAPSFDAVAKISDLLPEDDRYDRGED